MKKIFVPRGVDAVEPRYIFTPKMQDRLVNLRRRLGSELRIVFRNTYMWLTIPNSDNWSEGDV